MPSLADMLRPDGTQKKNGWLGPRNRTDGSGMVSTEISVGVPIFGVEQDVPTMVPSLSPEEMALLLGRELSPAEIPDSIIDKAIRHAQIRSAVGLSPFADDNESPVPTRSPGPWRSGHVPQRGMSLAQLLAGMR
jgi:hypothetical protein